MEIIDAPFMFVPPKGFLEVKLVYGDFGPYTELPDTPGNKAFVRPLDTLWKSKNIVNLVNVCGTGLNIELHKKVAPIFEANLMAARVKCPRYPILSLGGFYQRHQRGDKANPLSIHSWGAAFDINPKTNPLGTKLVTDLPPEFVACFTAHGWEWGGFWKSVKDAMHFQFATGV